MVRKPSLGESWQHKFPIKDIFCSHSRAVNFSLKGRTAKCIHTLQKLAHNYIIEVLCNHCILVGLVRGVDMEKKVLYITTPEPLQRLKQVNCLMLGKNELSSDVYTRSKVSVAAFTCVKYALICPHRNSAMTTCNLMLTAIYQRWPSPSLFENSQYEEQ